MANNFDGKKIVIFGGAGFIGKYLINRFSKYSCDIQIVTRDLKKRKDLKFLGGLGQVNVSPITNFSEENIKDLVSEADIVVNLIGILYENEKQNFEEIHSKLPKIIAKVSKIAGVKSLIHFSALGVEKNIHSKYAISKFHGERNIRSEFPEAIILRPSVVFGKEDNFINMFSKLSILTPFLPIIGDPKIQISDNFFPTIIFPNGTLLQPIYVGDLADFTLKICFDNAKTINLAGPNILSFKEIIKLILKFNKRSRICVPIPFFLANILAFFSEKLPNPILTRDQVQLLKVNSISKAGYENLLRHVPIPKTLEVILPTYIY